MAFGVGSMPPQIDLEAIHVQQYALQHPEEDVEQPTEAGEPQNPPQPISAEPPVPAEASFMDVSAEVHGQKRGDDEPPAESPKRAKFADKGFSILESTFLADDTPAGESAPKTPKLTEGDGKINQVTSTDLSLYEHEDEKVTFSFEDGDLDEL